MDFLCTNVDINDECHRAVVSRKSKKLHACILNIIDIRQNAQN